MDHKKVSQALDGKKKSESRKTHTHGVHYERADNGGIRAHVHKHFGAGPHSEGHSHTEEHVLANHEDAQEHFDDHMGDQPEAGEMQPPEPAEQEQAGAGAGADPTQAAGM